MLNQIKTDGEVLDEILATSRASGNYAAYGPSIMGCVILATLYGMTGTLIGFIFQWLWLILACVSYYKMNKALKKINKEYKDGR